MSATARAFWIAAPGQGEIREEPLPAPGPGDVVVRAIYSGISRGTESIVFRGHVPASEYERMRAPFQVGAFPAPVKYGYSSVGLVERGPDDLEGRHVFTLYPHQSRYVLPAADVHPVPANVPTARAVLAANLETAINGVWDAGPHVGDHIVVIGGGTVGCLVAWLAGQITGCNVQLVDRNPRREPIAARLGVGFALPEGAHIEADLVVHASGSPDGLKLALQCAGFEATVVDLSWYGDAAVPLSLGEGFHAKRLTIRSSQVGHVAASQRARWSHKRRLELALSLLADSALDAMITGESAFEELPQVMAALSASPGDTLCHRIRY